MASPEYLSDLVVRDAIEPEVRKRVADATVIRQVFLFGTKNRQAATSMSRTRLGLNKSKV